MLSIERVEKSRLVGVRARAAIDGEKAAKEREVIIVAVERDSGRRGGPRHGVIAIGATRRLR